MSEDSSINKDSRDYVDRDYRPLTGPTNDYIGVNRVDNTTTFHDRSAGLSHSTHPVETNKDSLGQSVNMANQTGHILHRK